MTSIPKYLTIGNRIEQIRHKKGLSQAKFAKTIGISRPALSAIENGLTKPSMPILNTIEYKYGFRLEWILTGDEPIYVDPLSQPSVMPLTGRETSDRQLMFWISMITRIFEEGDKVKIEAIKAQLRALDPSTKKEENLKGHDG
jgi:transcriptional regulator with XRE-family HTH domain